MGSRKAGANLYSELKTNWRNSEKIALATASGKRYTYADAESLSARLVNALAAKGVKPSHRVAVQVEKSPEALFLCLACLRAGAAYLPLNTAYTEAELDYFLRDAEPTVFVCRPEKSAAGASLCANAGVPHSFTLGTAAPAQARKSELAGRGTG